ncbi:hypothetical protein PG985_003312 [Apiospora marii]|uniref:uncharacterized protein n=1 Tax=Apiospora marii TaxID=335849 RepID=UPI00312E31CD
MPTPDPDPIVISDTDDSDVEIIMVRPVVRPVAIPLETSDEEVSDEEVSDEEASDAESDIEDCISVIPDSPRPATVALPGHSAQNNSQERITVFPEPARPARGQWPWGSTKEKESLGKTIDADESHTESDSNSDTDGALTNSRSSDDWKPKAPSGKKKQAPKAANGV